MLQSAWEVGEVHLWFNCIQEIIFDREGPIVEPKLIYLATRHPSLARAAFTARWRQHGRLGMSMPRWKNIRRYAHCDVLQPGVEGISEAFDGVGLIWHRSPEARLRHRTDTSSQGQMEADEAETFAEPVRNFCLLAEEHEIRKGSPGPVKLIRFLQRREGVTRTEFLQRWIADAPRYFLSFPGLSQALLRYVQNHTLPPERGDAWGLPSDCVDEFWFESEKTAVEAFRNLIEMGEWERTLAPTVTCVLTNEVVLHDRPELV